MSQLATGLQQAATSKNSSNPSNSFWISHFVEVRPFSLDSPRTGFVLTLEQILVSNGNVSDLEIYAMTVTKAGNAAIFNQTCTGVCYNDYVIGSPSGYDNAYFEIGYVRVFSAAGTTTVVSPSTSSSGSGPGSTSTSSSSASRLRMMEKYVSVVAPVFVVIGALASGVVLL